jgi:hypothetical protein
VGVAEFHQTGAFGVFDHTAFQRNRSQFVRRTSAWPHGNSPAIRERAILAVLLGAAGGSGKAFGTGQTNARL